ncbi:FMN-binding protein [candidate division BRC1 bacterium HGW-BRC1-1]|nr:MAG: FMN-binding protein [candidate division BRC1 bacterium HGW-BRC1-1]
MIPEKLKEVLANEGVVAIATLGPDGPHLVNSWNKYVTIAEGNRLLIPVGTMHQTEANVTFNNQVLLTINSGSVEGNHGPGAGFLIKGTAKFVTSGPDFKIVAERFEWVRATLAVTVISAVQTW